MASTTLFPRASLKEVALELAQYVDAAAAGGNAEAVSAAAADRSASHDAEYIAAVNTLVAAGDWERFLDITLTKAAALPATSEEAVVDGCFSMATAMLNNLNAATIKRFVEKICGILTSDTTQRTKLRLVILSHVYNLLEVNTDIRFYVFLEIIKYSASTGLLSLLYSYLKDPDTWQKQWALSTEQARGLFLLVSQGLDTAGDKERSQTYLVAYLGTFEDASPAELAAVKDHACRAVLAFIKTSAGGAHKKHLVDMAAVKQLKSDATYSKLYDLLSIFSVDKLDAYLEFAKHNREYLSSIGVEHEASLETIRLWSLCSLASEAVDGVVPFSAIAATLQIDTADVEAWVVKAIGCGLIDARIDQLASVVRISRFTQRVFGDADWAQLQSQLHAWKGNVRSLLSSIRSSRAGGRS